MTEQLSREELITRLDESSLRQRSEQAYEQIKSLLQQKPTESRIIDEKKIKDYRIWIQIKCDCGNDINITEMCLENHCEKCMKIYKLNLFDSIQEYEIKR